MDELRRKAMARLQNRRPDLTELDTGDIRFLVHELEVYQAELEVQNEDLRRTQDELTNARDAYLDLYEFAPVGYLSLDPKGIIRRINLTAVTLSGQKRGSLMGRRIEALVAPEDRDACYRLIRESAGTENSKEGDLRMIRPDGRVLWINMNVALVPDTTGRKAGFRVILSDITARKEAEKALERHRDQLEVRVAERTAEAEQRAAALRQLALELSRAEDAERRRIAGILHDDLQQYLASMRFRLASLIPDELITPKIAERLALFDAIITDAIGKCRDLSHELSPPVLQQNGLLAALDWLARDVKKKHGLQVTLDISPEAEPASPAVAATLFHSARELLFNIVKHAGARHADLRADDEDGRIRIEVKDDGRGFDPSEVRKHQVKDGGFGLFAIEERIRFLGGSFDIIAAPGKGCRIRLAVPKAVRPETKILEALARGKQGAGVEPPNLRSRVQNGKIRILLADDHSVMRQGLAGIFENEGDFEVVAQAGNGREAVQMSGQTNPDVILMDITMPGMDGISATAEIMKTRPETRIIGLSMHEDDSIRKAMLGAGACAYAYKTAPSKKLIEIVRSVL